MGVSITGLWDNPVLIDKEILETGANIVKESNRYLAEKLGINISSRTTTIKPSGNASVVLGTSSGIHPAHAKNYFRIMQMNKDSDVAKYLKHNKPEILEESVWSSNKTDYAVYIPVKERETALTKKDVSTIEFLNVIKLVKQYWVDAGANKELGYSKYVSHNVSNTVTVDNWEECFDYVYNNNTYFCGISFLPKTGDKIYKQAPFTEVLMSDELVSKYGNGVFFASGLIVDMLHTFNNDLWNACTAILDKGFELSGDNIEVFKKKDIIRRVKKFAKNYFNSNFDLTIDCLKDVYLFHKWNNINRTFSVIDLNALLPKPKYVEVDTLGSIACSGGVCEI